MALMWGWHALVWIGQRCRQRFAGGGIDGTSPSCRTTCSELCRREQSRRRWACSIYDWPFQVEELLFKRYSLSLTLALLERLQAAPGLRPHQRVYAGIALAYDSG